MNENEMAFRRGAAIAQKQIEDQQSTAIARFWRVLYLAAAVVVTMLAIAIALTLFAPIFLGACLVGAWHLMIRMGYRAGRHELARAIETWNRE